MSQSAPTPALAVQQLTYEIPNFMPAVHQIVGGSASEIWAIALAVSGKMKFPDSGSEIRSTMGVPDGELPNGTSRYGVWREALVAVVSLLGDPEAHHRTGYNTKQLLYAMDEFFSNDRPEEA